MVKHILEFYLRGLWTNWMCPEESNQDGKGARHCFRCAMGTEWFNPEKEGLTWRLCCEEKLAAGAVDLPHRWKLRESDFSPLQKQGLSNWSSSGPGGLLYPAQQISQYQQRSSTMRSLWWKCGWRKASIGNREPNAYWMPTTRQLLRSQPSLSNTDTRAILTELIISMEGGWTKQSFKTLALKFYDTVSLIYSVVYDTT